MNKVARSSILISSIALGLIWVYQGLIPKLLFTHTGELEMLSQSGMFKGNEKLVLTIIGCAEILFGLVILFVRKKAVHAINIIALLILSAGAILSDVSLVTFPFNPFLLNIVMIAISMIAILNLEFLRKVSKNQIMKNYNQS